MTDPYQINPPAVLRSVFTPGAESTTDSSGSSKIASIA